VNYTVEEVFRTEGTPEFTFVRPSNFGEILVDIRTPGKPVIIEGQSGTGKTTTAKKIIEECLPGAGFQYLTARKATDMPRIISLAEGRETGLFIVDDFHRIDDETQSKIANLAKLAAEEYDAALYPKLVLIGINQVGSELIHLVHDIAKRCGIHRIASATEEITAELVKKGEEKLNVYLGSPKAIFAETRGDYWLTQLVCQMACVLNKVTETAPVATQLQFDPPIVRQRVTARLEHTYQEAVKEFCRGKRFRSTNDPYLKLLRAISEQESSIVDLTELANANEAVRGSINNIKEKRLSILIDSKPICDRYFYYNEETKHFAIEDPALFYYIRHLDWEALRKVCGFRTGDRAYEFDFAISFAGENRALAKAVAEQLEILDCSIFFDEFFEANYLGKAWHVRFQEIFGSQCRFVICFLDKNYVEKIWPTFERESFTPRVPEGAVIPVFLDETPVPGIPRDIVGIVFKVATLTPENLTNRVTDEIVLKIAHRLEDV
jgi:hypothetical protein